MAVSAFRRRWPERNQPHPYGYGSQARGGGIARSGDDPLRAAGDRQRFRRQPGAGSKKASICLCYHFGPDGLSEAKKTIENFVARAIRLYEHEPGDASARLGSYVRRWVRWTGAGLAVADIPARNGAAAG